MRHCHSRNHIEFFLEESNRYEVLVVQPNHIVDLPMERTQLICLKFIIFGYREVEIVLKYGMSLQPMDDSIFSEYRLSQRAKISYFDLILPIQKPQVLIQFLRKPKFLQFGGVVDLGAESVEESLGQSQMAERIEIFRDVAIHHFDPLPHVLQIIIIAYITSQGTVLNYYYSNFNSSMGNQCEGTQDHQYRELMGNFQAQRQRMEEYERKIKENETLLTSKIEDFNQERERFERERLAFEKSRRYGETKRSTSTIPEEEDQQNSEAISPLASTALSASPNPNPNSKSNKLCDFQFIVNYHFR